MMRVYKFEITALYVRLFLNSYSSQHSSNRFNIPFELHFGFNASDFLERIRNSRVAFVGDSIGRN